MMRELRDGGGSPAALEETSSSWSPSRKTGVGTAYHTSSTIWFTLGRGGALNEIYYPNVDTPNTRDVRFLVTDGKSFVDAESADFESSIELIDTNCLGYRVISRSATRNYRIEKEVIADPYLPVCMMRCRLIVEDEALRGKLKVWLHCVPRCGGEAANNKGRSIPWKDQWALEASVKSGPYLTVVCGRGFEKAAVREGSGRRFEEDLRKVFDLANAGDQVAKGEVELIGSVLNPEEGDFVVSIALGQGAAHALAAAEQSLFDPFDERISKYIEQWKRAGGQGSEEGKSQPTRNGLYDLSRMLLLAHEDKTCQGALVASLSIPWGESKGDGERGGYHVVWPRDLLNSASALLLCGHAETARRALVYLAAIQREDGSMPQNCFLNGQPYMDGEQLDEVAAPVILAWRLKEAGELGCFDPWVMVRNAANYLLCKGPVTGQERWEENAGYSPSTLAAIISAMVCAAEFANERGTDASLYLEYADWLDANLESWCSTYNGELVSDIKSHFIRLNPVDSEQLQQLPDPNDSIIGIANGGGEWPARNVVSVDFLELVRLGVRAAYDPLIVDTVRAVDEVLQYDFADGPSWLRYNHDGYGQKEDGSSFQGEGKGGCWPLLTGERGHYELAAGRDATFALRTMESFANEGGLLPEQIWRGEDSADGRFEAGDAIGSAIPLCWAHAEYISLYHSIEAGRPLSRIEPVFRRYASKKERSDLRKVFASETHPRPYGSGADKVVVVTRWAHRSKVERGDFKESETHPLGVEYSEAEVSTDGRLRVEIENKEKKV